PAPTEGTSRAAPKLAAVPMPASKPQPKAQTDTAQFPSPQAPSQQTPSQQTPPQAAFPQAGAPSAAPISAPPPAFAPDLTVGASAATPSNSFEGRWGAIR